jgi:hypothetical protein
MKKKQDYDAEVGDAQVAVRRPRKRKQTDPHGRGTATKVARPRKAGKLKLLPEMPLDILFEVCSFTQLICVPLTTTQIFCHLDPLDVLRLAWTSKSVRQILMRRSARPIWRSALGSLPNLPDCPPDMSEPQWVFLAFVPQCHVQSRFLFDPGAGLLSFSFFLDLLYSQRPQSHLGIPTSRML